MNFSRSRLSGPRNRVTRLLAVMLVSLAMAQASTLLYVSNGTTLFSLNPSNGNVLDTQTLSNGMLQAMTFSPTGVLYGLFTPDYDVARLGIINPTNGTVSFLALDTGRYAPTGLAFDSFGNLYALFDQEIFGLNPSTGASSASAVGCGDYGVRSLAFGSEAAARVVGPGQTFQQVAINGVGCGAGSGSGSSSGSGASPGFQAFTNSNGVSYAIDWTKYNVQLVTFDGATFSAAPVFTNVGVLSVLSEGASIAVFDSGVMAPEPGSIVLLGLGLGGMLLHRRYR